MVEYSGQTSMVKVFNIKENLDDAKELLKWARICTYRGEISFMIPNIMSNSKKSFYGPKPQNKEESRLLSIMMDEDTAISIQNEIDCWERIDQYASAALKKYQTTLEEDRELLK